jgi:hypothetical protein
MCPACMTSIALIAAGGTSASGLAVLALTRFSARKRTRLRAWKTRTEVAKWPLPVHAEGRLLGLWKGNSGGESS